MLNRISNIYNKIILKLLYTDEHWFRRIFNWSGNSRIDTSMKVITRIGDGYVWPILGIGILVFDYQAGMFIFRSGILAFAIELPLISVIKKKTLRRRPYIANPDIIKLLNPQEPYSFPSGHTAGAFIFAYIVGEVFPFLFYPLIGLASLIGFSRIYIGVHYPLDVVAGMIGGMLSALTALKILH